MLLQAERLSINFGSRQLLRSCGFTLLRCADRMLDDGGHGTTWFLIARK